MFRRCGNAAKTYLYSHATSSRNMRNAWAGTLKRFLPLPWTHSRGIDWPGNIRELQNVLERSVILTNGSTLHVAMPEFMEAAAPGSPRSRNSEASQASEREQIIKALEEAKGQVGGPDGAAARLGLKRTTLQNRMQKYKIARQYR